jgi:hypothetical protein
MDLRYYFTIAGVENALGFYQISYALSFVVNTAQLNPLD